MSGMTLKQFAKKEFFDALQAYKDVMAAPRCPEWNMAFVAVSVRLHAAKGGVPKSLWPLAGHRRLWAENTPKVAVQ
jgi:hypothetical protein